jgi:O-methyltransferase
MTESIWVSQFDQGGFRRNLRQRILDVCSRLLGRLGVRVQARMNIDPASCWHDERFAGRFGAEELACRERVDWPDASDSVRQDMLILLTAAIERRGVAGAIAEVGVRHGMTARTLLAAFPDRDFVLIDTMAGFTDLDLDAERTTTHQVVTRPYAPDPRQRDAFLASIAGRPNTQVIQCDVSDLESHASRDRRYAMVHVDVDLYRPTKAALAYFAPRMTPGGFIVVHDYNAWPGARIATDELIADGAMKAAVPMPDKSGTIVLAF